MRLVQIMGSASSGGAEGFFARLCIGLAEKGVDQQIVVRSKAACLPALRRHGLNAVELPFVSNHDLWTRWRLSRLLRASTPDLVLTWMNRATLLCPRGRFVHAARLGGYYSLKYYRKCHHLIGNTEDIVAYCRRSGWAEDRTHYLPNFADALGQEEQSPVRLARPQAPLLLALGRLHDDKAFDILLTALSYLPGVVLWLAGQGPEQRSLEIMARQLGLEDRVRFLGWRNDVGALLATADCLVCPSRVEPLGNVILEAWAHRRPVVAAASAGPAGLIEEGRTGLLAPIDDAATLAQKLSQVLADTALSRQLGENGYRHYCANFSRKAVLDRYLHCLTGLAQ